MVKPSVGIQNKVPHSGFPDAACRHKSIDFCGNRIAFYFDLDFCTLSDIHGKKLFADFLVTLPLKPAAKTTLSPTFKAASIA